MAANQNTPLIKEIAEKQLEQGLQISILMNQVSDLKNDMAQLLFYINDDHKTGNPGIVSQHRNDSKRLDKLEQFKNELKVSVAVIGAFAGIVGNLILIVIKNFLKL